MRRPAPFGLAARASLAALVILFSVAAAERAYAQGEEKCQGKPLLDEIRERGVLRISAGTAPPSNWFDTETNKPMGFNIDILEAVAKRLGVDNIEVSNTNVNGYIANVTSGRADVTGALVETPQRAEVLDFTVVYKWTVLAVMKREGDDRIKTEADLKDKTVVVPFGTIEQMVGENMKAAGAIGNLIIAQTSNDVLSYLRSGRADAGIEQSILAQYEEEQNPDLNIDATLPVDPKWMGEEQRAGSRFGFKKSPCNDSLLAEVNRILLEMRNDGSLIEIYKRYNITDERVWTPPPGWKDET